MHPFTYDLPVDRIAQRPIDPPDAARMMVIDRAQETIEHHIFRDLPRFLGRNDHLVFNDSRVIPARFFGVLEGEQGREVELLLLRQEAHNARWECLGRPLRKIRAAGRILIASDLEAVVVAAPSRERVVVEFRTSSGTPITELLRRYGSMPIPPYIREGRADERDRSDYQTVFARHDGSVAAPTASLHFTPELLTRLSEQSGARSSYLTLHVGAASFKPVLVDGELRAPEAEEFRVPPAVLSAVQATRSGGGRVIAVGTTVVRALESAVRKQCSDQLEATALFIQPGFNFELVTALVTNFHQPGTTHLLLVEAVLGRALLQRAYGEALTHGYRFLSYGDGMLIL